MARGNPNFKKGMAKLPKSGRQKGTGNHFKVSKIKEVLAEKKINPAEKIIELMFLLEPHDQLKAWCFLASYCEAKPAEAETGNENSSEQVAERVKDLTDEQLQKAITYNGGRDVGRG